jgi:hypothetical protein
MEYEKTLDDVTIHGQFFHRVTAPVTEQIGVTDLNFKHLPFVHKNIEFGWIGSCVIPLDGK